LQIDDTLVERDFHGLRVEMERPDQDVVPDLLSCGLVAPKEGLDQVNTADDAHQVPAISWQTP
jgi:hypothetical protein